MTWGIWLREEVLDLFRESGKLPAQRICTSHDDDGNRPNGLFLEQLNFEINSLKQAAYLSPRDTRSRFSVWYRNNRSKLAERRKAKRTPSSHSAGHRCSRCSLSGHNARTCKGTPCVSTL